jgi:hypothetical protein
MIFEFVAEAQAEFWHAADRYESKEAGLGIRFRNEVSHVIQRILADPYLWRERRGGYRRVNCPVFPYYVAYFIRDQKIVIAAVAHGHRKPNYWKRRAKNI